MKNKSTTKLNLNGTELSGDSTKLGDEGVKQVFENLKKNTQIEELNLTSNNISSLGCKYVRECLQMNFTLTKVDLSFNPIGVGVGEVGEALKYNKTIKTLNLYNTSMGVEGLKLLLEGIKLNSSIVSLYLADNQIGEEGSKILASAIKFNQKIREIFLGDNLVGDRGVLSLSEALTFNSTLEKINLSYNGIGEEGMKHVLEAIQLNPSLTQLFLDGNKTNEKVLSQIESLMEENKKDKETASMRSLINYLSLFFIHKRTLSSLEEANLVEKWSKVDSLKVQVCITESYGKKIWKEVFCKVEEILEKNKSLRQAVLENDVEKANSLLLKGANPNVREGENGKSCLLDYIQNEKCKQINFQMIQLLLEFDASPNMRDNLSNTFFHLLKENRVCFEGEWMEGERWEGRGICFWNDQLSKEEWIFVGKLEEGKPADGQLLLYSVTKENTKLRVKFKNGRRIGEAILVENKKEFLLQFDEDGNELIECRKRTFVGNRIMIVGNQNVTLKQTIFFILNTYLLILLSLVRLERFEFVFNKLFFNVEVILFPDNFQEETLRNS